MFRPASDYIFAKRLTADTQTASGLIIPDAAQEKPQEAEVFAVGPGANNPASGVRIPLSVAVGDRILFGKWSGLEIKLDGEQYLILREQEVLAVL
jgi:chaperonin GroES